MTNYQIRDLNLAAAGDQKIEWVSKHMPILNRIREKYATAQPFAGRRVAVSVHLEAKTAYLALTLKALGADLAVTGSNPLSTQDDVAAALVGRGIPVFAWHGATEEEYCAHLAATLQHKPEYIIDDGGDLVNLLHTQKRDLLPLVKGGCEETTTGVLRLRAMAEARELAFPMIAVNDALCKHLFDNRYGTGQSTWDGIMRTTNLVVAGKTVVVAGYGWCGRGVALRAKGLGARVIICEVDPVKALEALMDGYMVMPALEAARIGDLFIAVTGCKDVFAEPHFALMKDGAILANAGHFDVEVNKKDLAAMAKAVTEARTNITAYHLKDGRRLYLLAEGRLVNLAAGDGHPAEIMDLSFALQILSLLYVIEAEKEGGLAAGVYNVPQKIDHLVAQLALEANGVKIDTLSADQQRYLNSW
ncbi:MAG TPA: adenosylhomocysteinase [Hydrogenispora sp.]|jgi:adenosylhomocysteinase|nr:adenosylhomocysteinase [Hydrogenispora sp.]